MVREMLRLDSFYCVEESTLSVHKDYPPLISLWEMLWCNISGGYSEANLIKSLHIFELCMLLPCFFDRFMGRNQTIVKRLLLIVGTIFAMTAVCLMFDAEKFATIYIDLIPPMMFAYMFLLVLDSKIDNSIFKVVAILISGFALMMTKQIAICYVLLILLAIVLKAFVEHKFCFRTILLSAGLTISGIVSYFLWSIETKRHSIVGQFDFGKISPSTMLGIVLGRGGSELQRKTYEKFVDSLVGSGISSCNIQFSAVQMSILLLLFILIVAIYFKQSNGIDVLSSPEVICASTMIVIGIVGYSLTLMVLYMFCFADGEMAQLASYGRYMGSFMMGLVLITIIATAHVKVTITRQKLSTRDYLITLAVILVLVSPNKLVALIPQVNRTPPLDSYYQQAVMLSNLTEDDSNIMIVSGHNFQNTVYIGYYLENRNLQNKYTCEDIANYCYDKKSLWDELIDSIAENDYLYVIDSSDYINKYIGEYAENKVIAEGTLYKVCRSPLCLKAINNVASLEE